MFGFKINLLSNISKTFFLKNFRKIVVLHKNLLRYKEILRYWTLYLKLFPFEVRIPEKIIYFHYLKK